jgi:two-component system, sensor histidine kinase FlrB
MNRNSQTAKSKHSGLKTAFAAFGSASAKLSQRFESLEAKVVWLTRELGEARAGQQRMGSRLAAIIDGLPGAVLLLDADSCVVELNSTAREMLGQPVPGERFESILEGNVLDPARLLGDIELRSGRFVTLSRRSLPGGEIVLLTDITESHLLQSYLARQQRLSTLGELAAGLAHQIRTPLAAALLYASRMTLPDCEPADLVRCAAKTAERLRELDKLITEMLAFARGAANLEPVSVNALLEQAAQWLRPALSAGSRLTIRTEAPDLKVCVNAPAFVSAVLNLATNAMQAANGNLEIELLARLSAEGRAEIVVSDDGPGIADHLKARVFEPFFTTRVRGTGLGLAIVKSIVEAHRGNIRLDDARPRGASFVIDLPAET